MNMTYNFSATQNNGRILSSADGVTGENVSYTYDSLNRLIAAATTSSGHVQGRGETGTAPNYPVTPRPETVTSDGSVGQLPNLPISSTPS